MATLNLTLKPFPIPDKVVIEMPVGRKQDGIQPLPTIALTDLDEATLQVLIEEFAENVMKAAGKA